MNLDLHLFENIKKREPHLKWNILTPISRSQCAQFWLFRHSLMLFKAQCLSSFTSTDLTDGLQFGWFSGCFLCFGELCHMLKMLQAIITTYNNGSLWIPKPLNAFDPHTYTKNHKQFNTRSSVHWTNLTM